MTASTSLIKQKTKINEGNYGRRNFEMGDKLLLNTQSTLKSKG